MKKALKQAPKAAAKKPNKNLIVAEAVAGASLLASLTGLAMYLFGHGHKSKMEKMKINVMSKVKKAEKKVAKTMKKLKK